LGGSNIESRCALSLVFNPLSIPDIALMSLSVAEVRHALHTLRTEWYENMTPDRPFLISQPAIEFTTMDPTQPSVTLRSHMTISQFACLFDYGQHLKRHRRLGTTLQRSCYD
jgi:hypothetical protein